VLRFLPGAIAFDTEKRGDARTWALSDIETIARPAPGELSISVRERSGLRRLPVREFRFQLKEDLPEPRYQALWRTMNNLRIGPAPDLPAGAPMMPGHVPATKLEGQKP
jgi:hypothetical protein